MKAEEILRLIERAGTTALKVEHLKAYANFQIDQAVIGDGKFTIKDFAIMHVDLCYEPTIDFNRECMIRCVEVGYEAYRLNLENKTI